MFSLFKRKPKYDEDAAFNDLARMFTGDNDDPTFKRSLLNSARVDFSLESLKYIDEYLEVLHKEPPTDKDLMRVILRCGAYVGEVVRRHSKTEFHWIGFQARTRDLRINSRSLSRK